MSKSIVDPKHSVEAGAGFRRGNNVRMGRHKERMRSLLKALLALVAAMSMLSWGGRPALSEPDPSAVPTQTLNAYPAQRVHFKVPIQGVRNAKVVTGLFRYTDKNGLLTTESPGGSVYLWGGLGLERSQPNVSFGNLFKEGEGIRFTVTPETPFTEDTIAITGIALVPRHLLPGEEVTLEALELDAVDSGGNPLDLRTRRLILQFPFPGTDPDAPGLIRTIAGGGQGTSGSPAYQALLEGPSGLDFDAAGNLYVAVGRENRVKRIRPDGILSLFAGSGGNTYAGDGGSALEAGMYAPVEVVADSQGNVYINEGGNDRIRKVDPNGIITTVAGRSDIPNGPGEPGDGDGKPATSAWISPADIALDAQGRLLIADSMHYRIRMVGPDGILRTLAGTGEQGFSGDGGPAAQARLTMPVGLAVWGEEVYVADGHRIRRIDREGIITTLAGNGSPGFGGDGGPAVDALLSGPHHMTFDAQGNLYVVDRGNLRVRKINRAGVITTVAGNGSEGHSGDGGPATGAGFSAPADVAVDPHGNLYITDYQANVIRMVNGGIPQPLHAPASLDVRSGQNVGFTLPLTGIRGATRIEGTLTVAGPEGVSLAPSGLALDPPADGVALTVTAGAADVRVKLESPAALEADSLTLRGTVVVPATAGEGEQYLLSWSALEAAVGEGAEFPVGSRRLLMNVRTPPELGQRAGRIVTMAGRGEPGYGGDDAPATGARLNLPTGLAVGASGELYIADMMNNRVRRWAEGWMYTAAGTGEVGDSGDGGFGLVARLSRPEEVAVDARGALHIADVGNRKVRVLEASGLMGASPYGFAPDGIAADAEGNHFYSLLGQSWVMKVVTSQGYSYAYAAGGSPISGGGSSSTTARHPEFSGADGMAVDARGNLYIADAKAARVWKVTLRGELVPVAGTGAQGFSGDGGPAERAELNRPQAVVADAAGNLFVADTGNARIRRVSPDGLISTVAGNGNEGYSGDGGPAAEASLSTPYGIAVNAEGDLLIADTLNHRIRRVIEAAAPGLVAGKPFPGSGDVTRDGTVDVQDAIAVLKEIVGLGDLTAEARAFGDMDASLLLDTGDAVRILRKVAGLD